MRASAPSEGPSINPLSHTPHGVQQWTNNNNNNNKQVTAQVTSHNKQTTSHKKSQNISLITLVVGLRCLAREAATDQANMSTEDYDVFNIVSPPIKATFGLNSNKVNSIISSNNNNRGNKNNISNKSMLQKSHNSFATGNLASKQKSHSPTISPAFGIPLDSYNKSQHSKQPPFVSPALPAPSPPPKPEGKKIQPVGASLQMNSNRQMAGLQKNKTELDIVVVKKGVALTTGAGTAVTLLRQTHSMTIPKHTHAQPSFMDMESICAPPHDCDQEPQPPCQYMQHQHQQPSQPSQSQSQRAGGGAVIGRLFNNNNNNNNNYNSSSGSGNGGRKKQQLESLGQSSSFNSGRRNGHNQQQKQHLQQQQQPISSGGPSTNFNSSRRRVSASASKLSVSASAPVAGGSSLIPFDLCDDDDDNSVRSVRSSDMSAPSASASGVYSLPSSSPTTKQQQQQFGSPPPPISATCIYMVWLTN